MKNQVKKIIVKVKIKNSKWYDQIVEVQVENNLILSIEPSKNTSTNLLLYLPTIDMVASSGEPNNNNRETLNSLSNAAENGGFSSLFHFSSNHNFLDSKKSLGLVKNQAMGLNTHFEFVGSLHLSEQANLMTEIREMQNIGAIAFSNLLHKEMSSSFLSNIMLYAKGCNAKLILSPNNLYLSKNGQINQGIQSLIMGYKGIPIEAETIALKEILAIANYTEYSPTIIDISCQESLDIIEEYRKKMDIKVGCSVSNLYFSEERLKEYNTNFKVFPPLRNLKDKNTLIEGIKSKKIDFIYSQHNPWTAEEKFVEFDIAEFGTSSIESAISAAISAIGFENIDKIIDCFSINIYKFFNIKIAEFEKGSKANFCVIEKDNWKFDALKSKSKSKFSAYDGEIFDYKASLLCQI